LQVQAASPFVTMSAYRASAVPTGLPAHSSTQMLAWMIPPGAIGPGVRHSWPRSRYSRAPRGMDLQHAYIKMSADDDLSRKIAPRPAAGGAKIARWNRAARSKVARRIERLLRRRLWIAFLELALGRSSRDAAQVRTGCGDRAAGCELEIVAVDLPG
jgi:hypothetical protein